jgi:hypothetical protein
MEWPALDTMPPESAQDDFVPIRNAAQTALKTVGIRKHEASWTDFGRAVVHENGGRSS